MFVILSVDFDLFHVVCIAVCHCELLGHRTLWCVPAQVPVIPALPWFPSKPLVMAALALAVAACAHIRPLAQSLSRPIYLTQTSAFRPSPAYLSSAWYSLGFSNSFSVTPPCQP